MLAHHAVSAAKVCWSRRMVGTGPDHQPVRIVRTKVEAYAIALEHNKQHGVNAVWVHRECMKNGKWVPEGVSKYWHIMPVALPEGGQRYWAFGPDDEAVKASTKEEAYNIALKHNKEHGVDLVYVYDLGGKGGKWEKPEAERVEKVREAKKRRPHIPEEMLRKLAVAAIAASKRLKKVFFPVDHNEDTPETVAILLQCWHILPVVRDEDEGEKWWVLGPNNKASQEASTAGPFKTRKEAFWIALEHNRTLGVNAVYVHSRDENGEIGDGDFEEPSEEDFDDDGQQSSRCSSSQSWRSAIKR